MRRVLIPADLPPTRWQARNRSDFSPSVFRPAGGRVWSSYWCNGFVYANDMLRGVDVLLLSDNVRSGARQLPYANPQTQQSVIP